MSMSHAMKTAATVSLALALTATLCFATEDLVIDDFEYPSAEAAQAVWLPSERSQPAGILERDGGTALRLNADFTGDLSRAVYDRSVDLDLSRWGRLSLDVYVDQPGLFRGMTIYFRSGGGWYGASVPMGRQGWNSVNLTRSSFRTEDSPGPWSEIDTIRLSAWRGSDETGFCAVDNLMAHREPYALVIGSHTMNKGGAEAKGVQSVADTVSNLLAEAGILTSTIGDEDVEAGFLSDYEFAVFPYNPDMTEEEVAAIREYVAGGGRLMAFYQLRSDLGDLLGARSVGWQRQEYAGQFSEIRFEGADEFEGIPGSVQQNSWNLTVAEPTEAGRVIAWWHDADGENTNVPAFIASDAGLWMSHILTDSDRSGKQRMLVSMLGRYLPEIWPQAAQRALEPPRQIGLIGDPDDAVRWIEAHASDAPDAAGVAAALVEHRRMLADAREALGAEEYARATDTASAAWDRLRDAYLMAQKSRDAEFRGWWNHSGTGAFDTWEESMQNLETNGFNAAVPNMLWGGAALYRSEYLPAHPVLAERGDQIAECVEAAKRHGIEVHVWKVNWNLASRAPEEFVQQLRDEGRLQLSFGGVELLWLCPSDPRNLELELNTMVEVARNYDVDGAHFDYIRYPGAQGCFCEGCHERFEQDTGLTVENWPADLRTDALKDAWTQWRCDNISRLVEATAREVRAIKPHCKISAAVFGQYPECRVSVGQDWVYWIEQGWLDFACPMNYLPEDAAFATTVARQMEQVAGRVPLYPGIGAWKLSTADRVAGQVQIARELGADGFTIFDYNIGLAQNLAPALGRSLLAEEALLPHNAPHFEFDLGGELTREQTFGLHVQPGATVTATVARAADVEGRRFGKELAEIVLQDASGRVLQRLGAAPQLGDDPVEVTVTLPGEGLFRLAVVGEYDDGDTGVQQFVTRGIPIIAGTLSADIAHIL